MKSFFCKLDESGFFYISNTRLIIELAGERERERERERRQKGENKERVRGENTDGKVRRERGIERKT